MSTKLPVVHITKPEPGYYISQSVNNGICSVLEQEKHSLRRKLTSTESEYEVRIQELTIDLQNIKSELHTERDTIKHTERERSQLIDQLTEQNQRLTTQLKERSRPHFTMHFSNRVKIKPESGTVDDSSKHLQLSGLRDEINMLSEQKMDLERRIDSLLDEREGLSSHLDATSDRLVMLEKQSREQEAMLRNRDRDLDDLRHTNLSLTDRLEAYSRNSSSPSMGHTSLQNEIDMSDHEVSRPHSHPSIPENLLDLEEDDIIECDDPLFPSTDSESLKTGTTSLRHEVVDAVGQLRVMIDQLRHRRRNSLTSLSTNSSDELTPDKLKSGVLGGVVRELKGLVRDLLRREAQGECAACGRSEDRLQLEQEVHRALEAVDKLNIELADAKDKLKAKSDEAADLSHQVTLGEAQLKAVAEQRDNLKHDLDNTHLAKDELIKKVRDTWKTWGKAGTNTACEPEIQSQTRVMICVIPHCTIKNGLSRIQQSGALQQLEQWQVDMQQLLDEQMRRKLSKLEMGGAAAAAAAAARCQAASDSDSSCSGKTSPRKNSRLFSILTTLKR
nr:bicaudal D-related protein homolog [Cherax quadricarinatus]